ncbi:MAG: hypothetical protein ACKO7W_07175 [Elainella sp.]
MGNPQAMLREVLSWTNGQPFLTQKVCKLIRSAQDQIPPNAEAEWIETLVRSQIIENWEFNDEPEHLRTIRDRILKDREKAAQLLALYQRVLQAEIPVAESPEQLELLLSGLIIKHQDVLKVHNRIYQIIFNQQWIDRTLADL